MCSSNLTMNPMIGGEKESSELSLPQLKLGMVKKSGPLFSLTEET